MSELVIKISGDIKNYKKALQDAESKTEDLSGALEKTAKVSAVAFAGLTAAVGLSVRAYAESEAAGRALETSLRNQGILSSALVEKYGAQAEALQVLTGVDDDAITAGQALMQGFLGQTEISEELTKAVLDLAQGTGMDLQSAFNLVGKSIGTSTNALGRYGIELDQNWSKQEKLKATIQGINGLYEGQAAAANQGLGSIRGLSSAFGNLTEELGKRFAPAITIGIQKLTEMLNWVKKHSWVTDLAASFITAGTVVTALTAIVATAGIGWLKYKAIMEAAGLATRAMSLATKGLVAATGIGLLVVVLTEVALNWDTVWPRMQAVYAAFVDNVTSLTDGLGKILSGVFKFDLSAIKEGLAQVKDTLAKGYADATRDLPPAISGKFAATEPSKGRSRKNADDGSEEVDLNEMDAENERQKRMAEETKKAEKDAKDQSIQDNKVIADQMAGVFTNMSRGAEGAAAAFSSIGGTVANIIAPGFGSVVEAALNFFTAGPEKVRESIAAFLMAIPGILQAVIDSIPAMIQALGENLYPLVIGVLDLLTSGIIDRLLDGSVFFVEKLIERAPDFMIALAARIPHMLPTLLAAMLECALFFQLQMPMVGVRLALELVKNAPAIIESFIKELPGAARVFVSELVEMLRSMFKTIGIGGQTDKIFGFSEGGIVTGGIRGRDSVPALLSPGELVIPPEKSFRDVMAGIASQFGGRGMSPAMAMAGGGSMRVMIGFDGREASQVLTARQVEDDALGISRRSS